MPEPDICFQTAMSGFMWLVFVFCWCTLREEQDHKTHKTLMTNFTINFLSQDQLHKKGIYEKVSFVGPGVLVVRKLSQEVRHNHPKTVFNLAIAS